MHVDNKGIVDRLRRGKRERIKPRAGDADLWFEIWEELHHLAARDVGLVVERVKATPHEERKEEDVAFSF